MKKYLQDNKRSLLMLVIGLIVLLLTSLFGSLVQTAAGNVKVYDLRDETNE